MGLSKREYFGNCEVRKDGAPMDPAVSSALQSITVEDCLNRPAMFSLEMALLHEMRDGISGKEIQRISEKFFNRFLPGTEMDVRLGNELPEPLMKGRVAAIEPEYDFTNPRLIIRGYDRLFDLRFGTKRRSFTDTRDSVIARRLATEAGLIPADVRSTSTVHPYLFQNNQSNYDFLLERALRLDFEISVDDRRFRFGPSREDSTPELELDFAPTGLLKNFSVQMRTLTQHSEVEMRGWDANRKKVIRSKSRPGDEGVPPRAGERSGFDYARVGFSAGATAVVDEPLVDDRDAEALAAAKYRRSLRNFITGRGEALGDVRIRAGNTVRLTGLGEKFSGVYYVVSSKHRWSTDGYFTSFEVRRPNI